MFDSNQLQQVLENICDNGILYSKKATGRYQLQFCIQDQCQTGKVYLDIQDAGKGIAQEDVNYIFEPFYTTKTEGTGLGLYIARELCQANGARITYLNAPEKGSCFRILFK